MVVEVAVAIEVKVVDKLAEIFGFQFSVAIFALVLAKVCRANKPFVLAVDTFKRRVGFKVSHGSQNLT